MEYGYVYLIVEGDHNGDEKYKIGVTKNDPDKRLKKCKFALVRFPSPNLDKGITE